MWALLHPLTEGAPSFRDVFVASLASMAAASHTSRRLPTLNPEPLQPALSIASAREMGTMGDNGHWPTVKRALNIRACRMSALEVHLDWALVGGIRVGRGLTNAAVEGEAAAMRMAARCLAQIATDSRVPANTFWAIVRVLADRVGALRVPTYLLGQPPAAHGSHVAAAVTAKPQHVQQGPAMQEEVIRVADAVRAVGLP